MDPKATPISTDDELSSIDIYQKYIATFKKIAKDGAESFYKGEIARQIVKDLEGTLTMEDLNSYSVLEREAVRTSIGDFEVLASPAPTTGPQLITVLNALEEYIVRYGSADMAKMNVDYLEILAQVSAFRLRKIRQSSR